MSNPTDELPYRVDYKIGAHLLNLHRFPVSFRSLERWPLRTKLKINGRNTFETAELFAIADAKIAAAIAAQSEKEAA